MNVLVYYFTLKLLAFYFKKLIQHLLLQTIEIHNDTLNGTMSEYQ